MTTTDPNRLGPVTREWVAALERRIEQLELRVGGAAEKTPREQFGWVIESELSPHSGPEYFTGCFTTRAMVWSNPGDHLAAIRFARKEDAEKVARQLSPFNNKHRVCEHAWIDSQPFAGMKRPVTGGDGGNSQCATSPSQAGVSEPSVTVHLVKRSPENAAAYWREQWEKMHAEVVSLRVESHEWKTKYESQCRGVKSYLEQIESLRAQLKQRSDQHWTCNGCGFSWNADPLPERDEHGYRVSPIKCKACECESLRTQLAAKEDIGSALAEARRQIQSYEIAIEKHNKKMASITQHGRPETVQEGLRFLAQWFDDLYEDKGTGRDEVQRDLRRWANEIDAQLATRR